MNWSQQTHHEGYKRTQTQSTKKTLSEIFKHLLLSSSSMFRQGMHDLKVWPGVEGDGGEPTTTPGRTSSSLTEDQMGRLAKVQYCMWAGDQG